MRAVLQRVKEASVYIDPAVYSRIDKGLLVLLGIEQEDGQEDIDWLVKKIVQLRIFSDDEGKMNLNVVEVNGEILVVSQFTLFASTKKGNRPGFTRAAGPATAIPLYESFIKVLKSEFKNEIKTGIFGADMKISLVNDGPVTILIDSKNKE
jgi:D-tyrosyl-tRNA(Tyr) deacylase